MVQYQVWHVWLLLYDISLVGAYMIYVHYLELGELMLSGLFGWLLRPLIVQIFLTLFSLRITTPKENSHPSSPLVLRLALIVVWVQ
jgi:hypothetical protein